jgi:predicted acetyltransferase
MKLKLLEYINANLPKGFDPYWIYLIIVDDKEVGRIVLREGNDSDRYFDGHIGYHIDKEFRGHNYSYQACLLLKNHIHKDHVIITCDPHNIASKKIIEKLGCEFIERKAIPTHLKKVFTKEEKEKLIYIWRLK